MKHLFTLLCLTFACVSSRAGVVYSFEDGTVPANFAAKIGTLTIQTTKAKLGTKSLQWDWAAGDTLTAAPMSMNTASIAANGGITVWLYNEHPTNRPLTIWFLEFANSTDRRCSLKINLNFKGWRRITARFRQDMGHAGYTLRSMKWAAPAVGIGTLYIDYLEFVNDVSWERMSDWQYTVNNPSDLDDYLAIHSAVPTAAPSPIAVTQEQREAIATIHLRLKNWHFGSANPTPNPHLNARIAAFNTYMANARNRMADLQLTPLPDGSVKASGLFPIDFYGKTIEGEKLKTFREINERYLLPLAYDAVKNNNEASKTAVSTIFDWYHDQGWAAGSALGTLRFEMLRSAGFYHAAYICRQLLTQTQTDRLAETQKWFTMYGKIHLPHPHRGENTDEIRTLLLPKLFTALSLKNEADRVDALQKYVAYANNALATAGGYLDCIKPDYSGYHHRGAYYNAYYPDALYAASLVYHTLAGTPFALSQTTYDNLKNALLTYQFISSGYHVPGAATGRFPTQTQTLEKILPAFAYLALSSETPDAQLAAAFKALWKPSEEPLKTYIARVATDITFKNTIGEVEKMVELAEKSNTIPPHTPTGTKILPYAGLYTTRTNHWTLTMKGYSKYVWDFEASANENIYGRYLSYGHVQYSALNSPATGFHPADPEWDWSHIPGTTAKYLPPQKLNANTTGKQRNFSDDPFLGGAVLDARASLFACSLHDNTFDKSFYAKKSICQFDTILYAMGSGIKCTDSEHEVHTTLFQNRKLTATDHITLNGATVTSNQINLANPAIVDNYGVAYLLKNGQANLTLGNNLITAHINHGTSPAGATYGYLIIPRASRQTIDALSEHFNDHFDLIRQDEQAHAIYHKPSRTLASAIFQADKASGIGPVQRVNRPLVLLLREEHPDTLQLAFSDPDMHRPSAAHVGVLKTAAIVAESQPAEVEVELKGEYQIHTSSVADITADTKAGNTVVKFSHAKDGQTYTVRLAKKSSAHTADTQSAPFALEQIAGNTYRISTRTPANYTLKLIDPAGNTLLHKPHLTAPHTLVLDTYPKGVFLLHATTGNKRLIKKIIKR